MNGFLSIPKTLQDKKDKRYLETNISENIANISANASDLLEHKSSSDHDGRYYTETEIDGFNFLRPATTTTINFDNSMTTAEMQALIDAQHKYIPYGEVLTFQFADGTYNITTTLLFTGFYGGGNLRIQGNTADTSLSTTKSVYLDFSSGGTDGIKVAYNTVAYINISYMKIKVYTSTFKKGITCDYNSGYIDIRANYVLGTANTAGYGIVVTAGKATVIKNYVSTLYYGILGIGLAMIFSSQNDDTGTQPKYGLTANRSLIFKYSTQPAGSTANELTVNGGQIW